MKTSDYAVKPVFVANFWKSFRRLLTGRNKELLQDFAKCNFDNIFAHTEAEREKKKAMTTEARRSRRIDYEPRDALHRRRRRPRRSVTRRSCPTRHASWTDE